MIGTEVVAAIRSIQPSANTTVSASRLAGTEKLSFLALPFGPDCYFGGNPLINRLINDMKNVSAEEVNKIEPMLPANFAYSYKMPKNPEQGYCRVNLDEFLDVVKGLVPLEDSNYLGTKCDTDARRYFKAFLAKESLPECCMVYKRGDIRAGLIGAESKKNGNSAFEAVPQAVALAGDFALDQVSKGLALWHEVLVVFVLTFGDSIQFGAVYLLEDCFPCATMLSRPLSLLLPSDRDIVSRWAAALALHCSRCVKAFSQRNIRLSKKPNSRCLLKSENLFLKPVVAYELEKASFAAVQLLCAFRMLHDYESCRKFIEFPLGQIGMPDEEQPQARDSVIDSLAAKFKGDDELYLHPGFPIIIYKWLGPEWRNCADCINELVPIRDVFVAKVEEVFEMVLAAGLVHLDGRLANFMCMLTDSSGKAQPELSLKLIDWDSCARVGYDLPASVVEALRGDYRYPPGETVATREEDPRGARGCK